MSQPFIGEIRMFAGNFAPVGWAFCDGQLLSISENETLFSLIGTIYGGDGQETFGLPDLRGRVPIHAGTGAGLSSRSVGANGGVESVTLTANQLPAHSHTMYGSQAIGSTPNPQGNVLARSTTVDAFINEPPSTTLNPTSVSVIGGSVSHENLMPTLCVSFIISLFGIYPSQP